MNRKRFNTIAYCCLIIISLASCKKEEVVLPESNDPVFRVDGSFDGQNFSLVAGDNNAYMHTMTEIVNGVEVFSGNLSNGDFSVEMGVYNGLIDMPSSQVVLELVDLNPNFSMNSAQGLMFLSKNMLVSPSGQYIEQIFWYIDGVFAGVNDVVIYDPGKWFGLVWGANRGGEVPKNKKRTNRPNIMQISPLTFQLTNLEIWNLLLIIWGMILTW